VPPWEDGNAVRYTGDQGRADRSLKPLDEPAAGTTFTREGGTDRRRRDVRPSPISTETISEMVRDLRSDLLAALDRAPASVAHMARAAGLDPSTVTRWRRGATARLLPAALMGAAVGLRLEWAPDRAGWLGADLEPTQLPPDREPWWPGAHEQDAPRPAVEREDMHHQLGMLAAELRWARSRLLEATASAAATDLEERIADCLQPPVQPAQTPSLETVVAHGWHAGLVLRWRLETDPWRVRPWRASEQPTTTQEAEEFIARYAGRAYSGIEHYCVQMDGEIWLGCHFCFVRVTDEPGARAFAASVGDSYFLIPDDPAGWIEPLEPSPAEDLAHAMRRLAKPPPRLQPLAVRSWDPHPFDDACVYALSDAAVKPLLDQRFLALVPGWPDEVSAVAYADRHPLHFFERHGQLVAVVAPVKQGPP
jgi:hypothetical protein